jgi:glycosyltransferase involved in cell wall biosynthesis
MNISFVIPSYNCENTLEESVDSIFNRNFENGDEVIIINDGSNDGTQKVIERLENKYKNKILIINNPINIGCPASRNIGIRKAKNDLIFNLDSDNILPINSIYKLKNELVREDADVSAFGEYYYFKNDVNKLSHKWICIPGKLTLENFLSGHINPGPGGNFLYKKSIWQKVDGYWEYGKGLHEAWGFTLKLLAANAKILVIPNTFYYHRHSHESLFIRESKKANQEIEITNKFIEHIFDLLNEETQKYVRNNPEWFCKLNKKPLVIKGSQAGQDGNIVYMSKIKNFIHKIRNL